MASKFSDAASRVRRNKKEVRGTPAPPAPAGVVYFRGNFETGNFNQWLYVAAENNGYPDNAGANHGNVYIVHNPPTGNQVAGPVASGNYAMRIDLQAEVTKPSRVDAVTPEYNITLGQDLYYTTEFWLPSNWSRPIPHPNWYVIGQFIAQQPSLVAGTNYVINQNSLQLIIQTGAALEGVGAAYNNGGAPSGGVPDLYAIPSPLMTLETWHQLILRVRVAADTSGIFQVWWRKRGETDWTQTVNQTGIPSLHWNANTGFRPMICKDFCDAYRVQTNATSTIYHDNFCRASTFAMAENCFINTSVS
jgi:hypothetical protein